jgi:hypothetical protein
VHASGSSAATPIRYRRINSRVYEISPPSFLAHHMVPSSHRRVTLELRVQERGAHTLRSLEEGTGSQKRGCSYGHTHPPGSPGRKATACQKIYGSIPLSLRGCIARGEKPLERKRSPGREAHQLSILAKAQCVATLTNMSLTCTLFTIAYVHLPVNTECVYRRVRTEGRRTCPVWGRQPGGSTTLQLCRYMLLHATREVWMNEHYHVCPGNALARKVRRI